MTEARAARARGAARPGFALLQAGFRPFFLGAALWAAVAIPLWLAMFAGSAMPPSLLPPLIWHIHEMVFGFAAAVVAGFLLTAVPGWTGRAPLRGTSLAVLVALWIAGRVGVLWSQGLGAPAAAALDLAFPAALAAMIAREILLSRNWRNLPVVAVLILLFAGNLLVHLDTLGAADSADLGNRIGL
ncbi:MAG: NnrS family protein, partial [Stellaceae bacterium]